MELANQAANRTADCAGIDVSEFRAWLARATPEQKDAAIYWLLRERFDPRANQQLDVYDDDEFLFACVISPGQREAFRYLEHPEILKELEQASREEMIPISEVHRELGLNVD